MSEKYKIFDKAKPYFLTLTVVGWLDVFTRKNHKLTIINSQQYCQKEKGLALFGYCLIPRHLHLRARAEGEYTLSEILGDFKKFASKAIVKQIIEEPESRREWMLKYFEDAAKPLNRIKNYKFWQDGNHPLEIYSSNFFYEKLNYTHQNPVEDLIVSKPEEYLFSSARNYAGLDNFLEVHLETQKLITYN